MIFTIEMHWKSFLVQKGTQNDFYYRNALEIIFSPKRKPKMISTIEMHWKSFLVQRGTQNDFYYRNALEIIFSPKRHPK